MTARVSSEARVLLETHLRSYEKLEVLHSLRVAARPMSRGELGDACGLDIGTTSTVLFDLAHAKLIEVDAVAGLARVGPAAREPVCEGLMALYAEDRAVVMEVVNTISMGKIRSMAARAFADAFVIRRKGRDGDG